MGGADRRGGGGMMVAYADIELRGELTHNAPLARMTSWRVGGPARQLYRPADRDDLLVFLDSLPADEPLLWLGLGSNLLIRDGGFPGTVIATQGRLNGIRREGKTRVVVEAGVSCAKLARYCARADLVGGEFFAGIPGTLGGALAMNAGAFGGETWDRVVSVETVDQAGRVQRLEASDFEVGYRRVALSAGHWFLSATIELQAGDGDQSRAQIRELLDKRAKTQPTSLPSCGSVFRNPEGDHAARLIESAGLKGFRMGGAEVSDKHANFIVNRGGATAADIEAVILHVAETVTREHGVLLEPEVRVVGVAAEARS